VTATVRPQYDLAPGTPVDQAGALRVPRLVLVAAGGCFLLLMLGQQWGKIVQETKLDMFAAPATYMSNSFHAWNPLQWFGSVQSQTVGLLLPIGPFFAAGSSLHIPLWVTQRLWMALLLTVACWGVVRLAEALDVGVAWTRVVSGVAYALGPLALTWAGTSVGFLPAALAPWAVLPLVKVGDHGSSRRAAARSGCALALMGGTNAAVVLAVLPIPFLWIVSRHDRRRWRLLAWWLLCVLLACAWWMGPLLVTGKYGYNYLPYTETGAVTTSTTSVYEAIRGGSYWTNYFVLNGPLLVGAWTLVSTAAAILGTTALSAIGLFGVARTRARVRRWMLLCLGVGVVAIGAGYAGPLGGPLAHPVQHLLNAPLAPIRNVGKFGPDLLLPLSLALATGLAALAASASRWVRPKPWVRAAIVPLMAAGAIAGSTSPMLLLRYYPSGGYVRIPTYWSDAARWLDGQHDLGTSLLVPAAPFAEYVWGRPIDEPFGALLDKPWAVRSIIPTGSNGSTDVMDAVEQALDAGQPTPGLGAFLARAGVDFVVERNDLDLAATGAPAPAIVHRVLSAASGLTEVAAFGPVLPESRALPGRAPVNSAQLPRATLPALEVFRVDGFVSAVEAYPLSSAVVLAGSPAGLLPALGAGLLDGQATLVNGDPKVPRGIAVPATATSVVTDSDQRRETGFGGVRDNTSYPLAAGQPSPGTRAPPRGFTVVPPGSQTVASPIGAALVTSSSYGSSPLLQQPAEGPGAAFDGDPSTVWVADATRNSLGQWVQIDFGRPVPVSRRAKWSPANSS